RTSVATLHRRVRRARVNALSCQSLSVPYFAVMSLKVFKEFKSCFLYRGFRLNKSPLDDSYTRLTRAFATDTG
ncbi:hypothetical protein OS493_038845, partial [Desmophyllum pertusum]